MRITRVVAYILLLTVIFGCSPEPPEATPSAVAGAPADFTYSITPSGSENVKIGGSEFIVATNNCESVVNSVETISRSRSFDVVLDADIARTLGAQFAGDAFIAESVIRAEIEVRLGVQLGIRETVEVSRQIETPGQYVSEATLQWVEIWDVGTISVSPSNQDFTIEIPYRVLTTIRLTQLSKKDTLCLTTPVAIPPITSDSTSTTTVMIEPPLPLRDIPIPFGDQANDSISNILASFPTGDVVFGTVRFSIPDLVNKASTQCASSIDWPAELQFRVDGISGVESVHMLINAGFTMTAAGSFGVVEIQFDDQPPLITDLVLGANIREWRFEVEETVGQLSSSSSQEIHRGLSDRGDIAVIDMLSIDIPADYQGSEMVAIVVRDQSLQLLGTADPCLFIVGLTVKARD